MRGELLNPDMGSCRITPRTAVAGRKCSFRITYTAGAVPVRKGGCIRFERPYYFPNPSLLNIPGDALCEVKSSRKGVAWVVDSQDFQAEKYKPGTPASGLLRRVKGRWRWFYNLRWGSYLYVTVTKGRLNRGDKLTLVYGIGGTQVPTMSQEFEFTVGVDPDGKRDAPYSGFHLVNGRYKVRVEPARAKSLHVVVPSVFQGRRVHPRAADKDLHGNLKPVQSTIKCRRVPLGKGTLRYRCARGKVAGTSNVGLTVSPWQDRSLFWGEIHGHTRRSDGLGTPEEYYRYARDAALLDFAAIGDHSCYMSEDDWQEEKDCAFRFHKPHEFVTINGYEINYNTEWRPYYGDKNVYFLSDDPPLVYDSDISCLNHRDFWEVIRELRRLGAMMVLHAHAGGVSSFYDETMVRLMEVHSACHSNYESLKTAKRYFAEYSGPGTYSYGGSASRRVTRKSVQDVLARGWRIGLISGSDCHAGHPGGNNGGRRRPGRIKGSLVGVYAPELTREAVWDALWNRRCYGTTGERIIVYLEVNGHPMGEEFAVSRRVRKLPLHIFAAGTDAIERIDIVRNNRDIHTIEAPGLIYEGDFEDAVPFDESFGPVAWYYLRVVQKDGHLAWSSPVWVKRG